MTALNKQALRETAEKAASDSWGYDRDEFNEALTPSTVLALLDELEAMHKYAKDRDAENEGLMLTVGRLRVERDAAEKRIAELSHHLQCAHGFIEHTEAFGHEASNGILCCGDAQWNIDESKSVLAAAGKGE